MKLIEYRIFLPLTVEENQVGQLWSFAECSHMNTGGGEGVEIIQSEFFKTPRDPVTDRIVFKQLPDFEEYEMQLAANKFKKSTSKENFNAERDQFTSLAERSKSLDREAEPGTTTNTTTNTTSHPAALVKEVPENEDRLQYGQFTHKVYKIASKVPWFVRRIAPRDSLVMREKCWNVYPQVKTVVTNEYFKGNFRLELDTITRECVNGEPEHNVHNLSPEMLEKREIVVVDIAEPTSFGQYKEDEDPTLFKSKKTGRGPLKRGEWISASQQPLICVYKLLLVEFKVFGLQSRFESYFRNAYKEMFCSFHKQIFCWLDKWHDLSLEEVRKIEEDLAKLLVTKINQGEISKQCLKGDA
jgi:hypothetical protein